MKWNYKLTFKRLITLKNKWKVNLKEKNKKESKIKNK